MSKKNLLFFILLFPVLISGCGQKALSKYLNAPATETIKIDVFSLTLHKQLGSCNLLPILHRVLVFSYVPLEKNGTDLFIGQLEILLDDSTGTYHANYREFPGTANTDQSQFQVTRYGNFEIIKAATSSANDKLILENLGVINPIILGTGVRFLLKFDADINRVIVLNEVLGSVRLKGTSLVNDNCP
ncbi:MAG: hypothetical protein PHY93_17425 [Bacteriovorax sp.]|nr:hypothetical protein [Bacteriovorax sp.]